MWFDVRERARVHALDQRDRRVRLVRIQQRVFQPPNAIGIESQRARRQVEPMPLLRRDLPFGQRFGEEVFVLPFEVAGQKAPRVLHLTGGRRTLEDSRRAIGAHPRRWYAGSTGVRDGRARRAHLLS